MIAFALLLAMLLNPPSYAQMSGELPRFDVGLILPLSGEQAAFGKEAQRGSDLALELFRQQNPQFASRINVILADNKSQLNEIDSLVSELSNRHRCQTLIGGVTSSEASRLLAAASKAQLSVIMPMATDVQSLPNAVFTSLALDDASQGKIMGQFASERGIQIAAVLKETDQSAQSLASNFITQFKARGGVIAADEYVDLNTLDFGLYMRSYIDKKATAVLLAVSADRARTIIKQAKNAGLNLVFLGSELWDTPTFFESLQQTGIQAYHVAAFASDDTTTESINFVNAFTSKYHRKPGGVAALAFDAMNLALSTYSRGPTTTRQQFSAALIATHDFVGTTGTVQGNDRNGRKIKSAVVKELTASGARFVQRVILQ